MTHPVLRDRRAADGAGHRRRAGDEAQERRGCRGGRDVARDGAVMLFVSSSGHGKRTKLDQFNRQGRGGQGVRGMKITASRGGVVAAFTVAPTTRSSCSPRRAISSAWAPRRSRRRAVTPPACGLPGSRPGETVVAVAPVLEADAGEDTSEHGECWPTTWARRRLRSPMRGHPRRVSARPRRRPGAGTHRAEHTGADRRRSRRRRRQRSCAAATAASVGYDRPTRSERRAASRVAAASAAPSTERRYRQTITKVDLWSVLKMSVCFYICAMAVTMVALSRCGRSPTRPA